MKYTTSLFSQYMKFLDAESYRMEAIIKKKDNHSAMSLELAQKSKQVLEKLHSESTSTYLSSRIAESLKLLKTNSVF